MKFIAYINVMPLKALLDPQGKAVTARLHTMDLKAIVDARIGKHMELAVEAKDRKAAEAAVERACKEMLHNPIMESYEFTVVASDESAAKKAAPAKKTAAKPVVKKAAAKPVAKKTTAAKKTAAKPAAQKATAKPSAKKAAPAKKTTAAKPAAKSAAKKTTKK